MTAPGHRQTPRGSSIIYADFSYFRSNSSAQPCTGFDYLDFLMPQHRNVGLFAARGTGEFSRCHANCIQLACILQ